MAAHDSSHTEPLASAFTLSNEPSQKWLPVLMYHRVVDQMDSADPYHTNIRVADFDAQMAYLKERGYQSISLDKVPNAISSDSACERRVAISFDDGYMDNYTHALPILQKYGLVATIMLVSDCMGGSNVWDAGKLETARLLPLDKVREMQRYGIYFGAHTATHPSLSQVSLPRARHELSLGKEKLEQMLGHEVATLAYPYGRSTPHVWQAAGELGYSVAFGVERWGRGLMDFGRIDAAACKGNTRLWRLKVSGHYLRLRENKLLRSAYRLPQQIRQLSLRKYLTNWQRPLDAAIEANV